MHIKTIFILLAVSITFAQITDVKVRDGGTINDIKLFGSNNEGLIFIIYTENRIYSINTLELPYFCLRDTVLEYWINYQFVGIGKREKY